MVLYESGHTMRRTYFPVDSIVSQLYVMESGASAEISLVGNEGMVGIAVFMGGESTPSRALVQSAGHALSLAGARLKHEFNNDGDMRMLMLRSTQALITQMAQTRKTVLRVLFGGQTGNRPPAILPSIRCPGYR